MPISQKIELFKHRCENLKSYIEIRVLGYYGCMEQTKRERLPDWIPFGNRTTGRRR
jgi:hypothetical protein